jgi:hypothetical protein
VLFWRHKNRGGRARLPPHASAASAASGVVRDSPTRQLQRGAAPAARAVRRQGLGQVKDKKPNLDFFWKLMFFESETFF